MNKGNLMKLTKTYNYFPVCVPRLLSRPLRCSLGLSFILYSLLFSAALLTGCSDDSSLDESRHVTFEAKSCATVLEEEGLDSDSRLYTPTAPYFTTRTDDPPAWTPPSPYVTYDNINNKFLQQKNLVNKSINVFFTQDRLSPMEGTFFYKDFDNTWRLSMEIENTGTYYLYGYIPKEDASSATILRYDGSAADGNNSYSNGSVLTINGLNSVTPSDVCVVIGAKDGRLSNDDTGDINGESDGNHIKAGQFEVYAKRAVMGSEGSPEGGNHIFLLFDHLYSSLRFRFIVDPVYAALRTIKLRKLELTSYDDQRGGVRSKYNATITLQSNSTGASPVVSVSFEPDNTSAYVSQAPIFDGEVSIPVYPNPPTEFMGCFVPGDYTSFKLRSTYDVYDYPDGNLIRQGCQAESTIDLTKKFGNDVHVTRGHCYSYTITVQPTYLYVLSEPDMDNPTVTVN